VEARPDPPVLRITTLNLLHDQIRNLSPAWTARRPAAAAMIRTLAPDVLCLQEVSARQLADLRADLPGYEIVAGVPSGPVRFAPWLRLLTPLARAWWGDYFEHGEHCPVLLRRDTVERIADGCGPLEPPPASVRALVTPHIVTWVRFRIRATGRTAAIHNTHLAILPGRALIGARRLRERLDRTWSGELQFVAGDFNARARGPVLRMLRSPAGDTPGFHDLWEDARARNGAHGTHDLPGGTPGPRIDYVLVRGVVAVPRAEITAPPAGAVRASDHRPVTVDVAM